MAVLGVLFVWLGLIGRWTGFQEEALAEGTIAGGALVAAVGLYVEVRRRAGG